ncbi:U6 snRNA phosphodiesterase-like [Patiria miniata]|uniref:U6 snRNA phosphodiesterase n=1 Tax=Patiria miniata TaxID=46514 RepID=A0A914AVC3_PATMI|nr:U6 snRNA phosphodiesterase-like [Patiria miniata]
MSGLEALQDYGSSSSDDDDEGFTEDPSQSQSANRHKQQNSVLPSLPPEILGMFGESSTTHPAEGGPQDPSMHHDGRVRSFEHVAGNWATYVYIPVDLTDRLQTVMEDLLGSLPSSVDMTPVPDLHISISRTVTLQYQWIDPFVDSINQQVASVDAFHYCFDDVEFYANDEKTRSFIGLKVGYGHQEMLKLVEGIDLCLKEFSLPVYYKEPSFHVSFGWCLGDYSKMLSSSDISIIQERFRRLCENGLLPISISEVWCKAGCKQFKIPLGIR